MESKSKTVSKVPKSQKANNPICIMYVEVNDANFGNTKCYSLQSGGPLFDIAIIFASNINFNTQTRKAYLHHNENVTRVLTNADQYVRPVQEKGIKVLLSILGNHQGAGICNFESQADAREFAVQLADAVAQYGLDGIDFDDEYARYGENGTGQPNAYSFIYLLRELRGLLPPEKLITFYYYGPAASRLQYEDMVAGQFVDYSYNAMYGTYSPPNVPGLGRDRLGPAAVNVQGTGVNTARQMAERTVQEGYGVYLTYALPNNDIRDYLTQVSQGLYGVETRIELGCLQTLPKEGEEGKAGCGCACK